MEVNSKVAVVTGASRGLGAALSSALVAKGATVYGLARNLDALTALQKKTGPKILSGNNGCHQP